MICFLTFGFMLNLPLAITADNFALLFSKTRVSRDIVLMTTSSITEEISKGSAILGPVVIQLSLICTESCALLRHIVW